MSSLYDVLEVKPTATQQEIKAAYRKMILMYHPDKAVVARHKDLDTMSAKFVEITHAYNTLIDPPKREMYDAIGGTQSFMDFFEAFVTTMMRNFNTNTPHLSRDIICLKVPVTIDELYNAKTKHIRFNTTKYEFGKWILTPKTVLISLHNFQNVYMFKGFGDALDETNAQQGDVEVSLDIQDMQHVEIDTILNKFDLHYTRALNLYEYYYANKIAITFLNGDILDIPYFPGKKTHQVKGGGLPYTNGDVDTYGDLYVFFELVLPKHVPPSNLLKEVINKYFSNIDI